MTFSPQNLLQQAQRLGKTVSDFVEDKAATVSSAIQTSANINVNGVADSVAGSVTELPAASIEPNIKIPTDYRDVQRWNEQELQRFNRILGITSKSGPPFPNELRDFASYNYVIGLGVLNNNEVNFPDKTYRVRDPEVMICRSGGGLGKNKATTIYEKNGQIEYYIDNLEVEAIISLASKTKQTNATNISFKVTEPYSMGLFLQTLQVAAVQADYKNYLEAPYCITIDFKGWDVNGNQITKPNLRRIYPIKLVNIDFQVTEGGSEYNITAIPWHEQGLADQIQNIKTDVNLKGRTVAELLQSGGFSLTSSMNEYQQKKKADKKVVQPDEYIIMFPTERASSKEKLLGEQADTESATTNKGLNNGEFEQRDIDKDEKVRIYQSITGLEDANVPADFDAELSKLLGVVVKRSGIGEAIRENAENQDNMNDIGKSELVQSYLDGGKQPFGRPKFVEETKQTGGPPSKNRTIGTGIFKRGNITISDKGRTLTFKSGTRIQEIVEEIIILSDYGKKISEAVPDENGMIPWFKIEVDVYQVTNYDQMDQTGEFPKVYVYRVVPYKAHISRYSPPSKTSPGIEQLKRQACKEYDYIYTGKNDDVLDFNIEFDKAFFVAITPFAGEYKGGEKDSKSESSGNATDTEKKETATGDTSNFSSSGNATTNDSEKSESGGEGGGFPDRTATSIARDFNDALVNSNVDLVKANMTIWGDPYYIADSGMGNYNASETPIINITEDGTMDYQSSEVDVSLNFRTPLDLNQEGGMDFPSLGTKPVGAFSGLYQVLFVSNKFSDGMFTQDLQMIRRRNQPGQDTTAEPTTEDNLMFKDAVVEPASANTSQGQGSSEATTTVTEENNTNTTETATTKTTTSTRSTTTVTESGGGSTTRTRSAAQSNRPVSPEVQKRIDAKAARRAARNNSPFLDDFPD